MGVNHHYARSTQKMDVSDIFNKYRSVTYMTFQYLIYGAIGWIVETAYIYIIHGHFSRRGLISHGLPIIPLFGYGGLLIVNLLKRWKHKPVTLYFFSVIMATAVELLTGLFNTFLLNRQSWNYYSIPLAFGGFVALPISLAWGLLITFVIYFVEPFLEIIFARSSHVVVGIVCVVSFACLYYHFIDFIALLFDMIQSG